MITQSCYLQSKPTKAPIVAGSDKPATVRSSHTLPSLRQRVWYTGLRKSIFRPLRRLRRSARTAIRLLRGDRWRRNRQAFWEGLAAHAESKPDFFFVQIGANDGRSQDPIHRLVKAGNWAGILIEPVPQAFESLKHNYADQRDRLTFVNAAIADRDGEVTMFVPVTSNGDLNRYSHLASLTRRVQSLDSREISVRSMRFETLLEKHQVSRIDLLIVDTEGYDFEILKMVDFGTIRPRYVQFEQSHLSPLARFRVRALLRGEGYKIFRMGDDTGAVLE